MLDDLAKQLAHFPTTGKCAIAVSGGGDSLALCLMMKVLGHDVEALHFNHNLRPEADDEALWLQHTLGRYGIACHIGTWAGDKPTQNIQKYARQARYGFFQKMAEQHGYSGVYIAHTKDDQLETFWLRLAHGSGLKGLGLPLKPVAKAGKLTLYRPLLDTPREALRTWLTGQGQSWLEDPSNSNEAFYRIRVRNMLPALESWGLGADAIFALMESCQKAEKTVQQQVAKSLDAIVTKDDKNLFVNKSLFAEHEALQKRIVIHICQQFGGEIYPPRSHKITRLIAGLEQGKTMPLGRLVFRPRNGGIIVEKQPARACEMGTSSL